MKMSKRLQADFASALNAVICGPGDDIATMRAAWLARYGSAGLTPKRSRWDAVWTIPRDQRRALFDVAYKDELLDDTHIDTMLRDYFSPKVPR
tara:strand:- start:190 stop:468 length:279 start_codon:yes stop_codon:yes gene_type:complete